MGELQVLLVGTQDRRSAPQTSPAVRDGIVYFPAPHGTRFKARNAAAGAVQLSVGNKADSCSSPTLANDRFFFGLSDG